MKKYYLFMLAIMFSCSRDEIDAKSADWAVGVWKTPIVSAGGNSAQTIWKISKIEGNRVGIMIYHTDGAANNDWEKNNPIAMISTAWVEKKNMLVIEDNLAATGAPFCGIKGSGNLDGDKLTMVFHTECPGEAQNPTTQEFTRQ